MNQPNVKWELREWLCLVAAILVGPLFLALNHTANLGFALAGAAYFVCCGTVIPLIAYAARRLKFLVWQVAVFSPIVSIILENRRDGIHLHGREAFMLVYFLWFFGTLLSSPLLIYYRLKPLPTRRRYIEGAAYAVFAILLYGGLTLLDH